MARIGFTQRFNEVPNGRKEEAEKSVWCMAVNSSHVLPWDFKLWAKYVWLVYDELELFEPDPFFIGRCFGIHEGVVNDLFAKLDALGFMVTLPPAAGGRYARRQLVSPVNCRQLIGQELDRLDLIDAGLRDMTVSQWRAQIGAPRLFDEFRRSSWSRVQCQNISVGRGSGGTRDVKNITG